jgi:hypothetical protein
LKKKKEEEEMAGSPEALAFQKAFKQFLSSYERLDDIDKPAKMRKVMRNVSTRETPNIEEMFSIVGAENADPFILMGANVSNNNNNNNNNNNGNPNGVAECHCVDCPYKLEVAKMDEFYTEMLTNPGLLG